MSTLAPPAAHATKPRVDRELEFATNIPAAHFGPHLPIAASPVAAFPVVHSGVGTIPAVPHTGHCALQTRIHSALAAQTFVPGKHIRIETHEGRVALHGRVRSYFHKQMAQETLRGIEGIAGIENHLIVEWDE